MKKIDIRHDSLEKSSTTKLNQHAVCVYLLFTNSLFDTNRYKNDYYWGKYSIKNIPKDLKQHTTKIMKCEKLKMISLTMKLINEPYKKQNFVIYAKRNQKQ